MSFREQLRLPEPRKDYSPNQGRTDVAVTSNASSLRITQPLAADSLAVTSANGSGA